MLKSFEDEVKTIHNDNHSKKQESNYDDFDSLPRHGTVLVGGDEDF